MLCVDVNRGGLKVTKVTTLHNHGPDSKYFRTVVPQSVVTALDLCMGDAVTWNPIDKESVVVRVVRH